MRMVVNEDFMKHKEWALENYNKYGRTDRAHSMAIDCELYERTMIEEGYWKKSSDWRIDGIDRGIAVDVKTLAGKYFNINTGQKILNIIAQRNVIYGYQFVEWVDRPNRPLALGDRVEVSCLGLLTYDMLADNIKVSMKVPHGYYADVRRLLIEKPNSSKPYRTNGYDRLR